MKTIKKIILLLLLTICVSACEDTGIVSNWLQNPVFEKPMTVVASTDSIILKEGHEKDTAVMFLLFQNVNKIHVFYFTQQYLIR